MGLPEQNEIRGYERRDQLRFIGKARLGHIPDTPGQRVFLVVRRLPRRYRTARAKNNERKQA